MCIGIPMQVIEAGTYQAWCQGQTEARMIDMRLLAPQPVGSWVLVFLGTAREILSPERAEQIQAALEGLRQIETGEFDAERWFSDLVGREPTLPDFLKKTQ